MTKKDLTANLSEFEKIQFEAITYAFPNEWKITKELRAGELWEIVDSMTNKKAGLYHWGIQWGLDGLRPNSKLTQDYEDWRDNFEEYVCDCCESSDLHEEQELREWYQKYIGDASIVHTIEDYDNTSQSKIDYQIKLAELIMQRDKIDLEIENVKQCLRLYLD